MEITKEQRGKWIRPSYGHYLCTNDSNDKDKKIFLSIFVPNDESADQYVEIDAEEYETIKKAKGQGVSIPEAEINQSLSLFAMTINSLSLSDEQSLKVKNLFPKWETFVGGKLEKDYKVLYQDRLYKVRQAIGTVLENQPPSIDTAALYEEINEKNAGTKEDPIPYNNNMELFNGKYYSQNGVVYKCTRDTGQPVYQDLSGLVGIYVEVVE